jgi:DNA-binding MarR family transcriptional regulator
MLMTRDFQSRLDEDLRERGIAGIGARHRSVFLHLGQHGGSRMVDLAASAGIRPQSMIKIIDELEVMGLILRHPDPTDSRAKLINFTESGHRLVSELSKSTHTVWQHYAAIVGEAVLETTFEGLRQLLENTSGDSNHE